MINRNASVLLIAGPERTRGPFGTGFVVAALNQERYVITCSHVFQRLPEGAPVLDPLASVVAGSPADEADISVLRCPRLTGTDPLDLLNLAPEAAKDRRFCAVGYEDRGPGRPRLQRCLRGRINEAAALDLAIGRKIPVLEFSLDSDDLPEGFSGSPLIDDDTGGVIGIILERRVTGGKHLALSVAALRDLWPDVLLVAAADLRHQEPPSREVRPTGPLAPTSRFRMERRSDRRVVQRVLRGTTLVIVAPPQSGKSTLLHGVQQSANAVGWETAYLDLELVPPAAINSTAAFLRELGDLLLSHLHDRTGVQPASFLGPLTSVADFHRATTKVLPADQKCLLLFDMYEGLHMSSASQCLLTLMRAVNNKRPLGPPWSNMHTLTACSLDQFLWRDAFSMSPFGLEVVPLSDFDVSEFRELAQRHGALGVIDDSEIRKAFETVAGHPLLSHLVLEAITNEDITLEEWIASTLRGEGAGGQHLRALASRLEPRPDLRKKLLHIAEHQGEVRLTDEEAAVALSHGLIKRASGNLSLRCPLYGLYLGNLKVR